jgi:hypothetical protein
MSCRLIDIFNNLIVHRVGPISVYGFHLEQLKPCWLPTLQSVHKITFRCHFQVHAPMLINPKYIIVIIIVYLLSLKLCNLL